MSLFANPNVIVVDQNGKAIEGAIVTPISLSMNYPKQKTNNKGELTITSKVQKVKWISVEKKGYQSSGHIDFTGPKPLKITLKKKKS